MGIEAQTDQAIPVSKPDLVLINKKKGTYNKVWTRE